MAEKSTITGFLAKNDLLVRLGLALVSGLLVVQLPLYNWESKLYDIRFRIRGARAPMNNIVLIGYDDRSIQTLSQHFPPAPEKHTELINKLAALNPKAIGFTYNLAEIYKNPTEQSRLIKGLKRERTPIFISDFAEGFGPKILPPALDAHFISAAEGLTRDNKSFAKDLVSRRLLTHLNHLPTFEMQMAESLRPQLNLRGATTYDKFQGLKLQEVLINFDGPAQTYPIISFADVLSGAVVLPDLSQSIVIIGRSDYVDMESSRYNPFETSRLILTKMETQAQAIASLARENTLIRAPTWVDGVLTVVAALVASSITMGSSPAIGVFLLLCFVLSVTALSQIVFMAAGTMINTIHPVLIIFLTYYIYVPYRLIVEYRKRFYYQKKHDLLKQVEELKTNFISLMSHDIKTPIAKIQGLAETGLKQAKNLPDGVTKLFRAIVDSTESLTRFVNTILDLSKIESGSVKLQLSSKDINALVSECIERVDFVATQKRITIKAELEPMFSVMMDPALIKQVIHNLIDNALKYSPEGSTVVIRTKESSDAVEFSIHDQGPGISETDLPHIFEKFYRPQSALESKTNGYGLGLYLVKYFIELHKGRVVAESALGQGSSFRFSLPLSSKA